MILRPVTPLSPCGPPITNRPVIIPDPSGVGYIEDPSLVLGMGWMPEAPKDANDLRAALIGRRLQHRGD